MSTDVLNPYAANVLSDLALTASEMESLRDRIDDNSDTLPMEAGEVADAYAHVHAIEKSVGAVKTRLRMDLMERLGEGEEDAKGVVAFQGEASRVEARPRVTATLDVAAMTALLQVKGLYVEGTDSNLFVPDAAKLQTDLVQVIGVMEKAGESVYAQLLRNLLDEHVRVKTTVSEKKVERLAKSKKLDPQEAAACYTTSTSHALYVVT